MKAAQLEVLDMAEGEVHPDHCPNLLEVEHSWKMLVKAKLDREMLTLVVVDLASSRPSQPSVLVVLEAWLAAEKAVDNHQLEIESDYHTAKLALFPVTGLLRHKRHIRWGERSTVMAKSDCYHLDNLPLQHREAAHILEAVAAWALDSYLQPSLRRQLQVPSLLAEGTLPFHGWDIHLGHSLAVVVPLARNLLWEDNRPWEALLSLEGQIHHGAEAYHFLDKDLAVHGHHWAIVLVREQRRQDLRQVA